MGNGPAASRLCSQEGGKRGLATQDYTSLAQGGAAFLRVHCQILQSKRVDAWAVLREVNLGMEGTKLLPMDRSVKSEFEREEVKQYRELRYLLLVHRLNWYSKASTNGKGCGSLCWGGQ